MPEGEIAARGGARRWRTVKLPNGRFVRVAVVSQAGPRGGHTVAGPVHETQAAQERRLNAEAAPKRIRLRRAKRGTVRLRKRG